MNAPECPFCGADPFHYVDIGVGTEAVAVVCCDLGDLYFRGAREPITGDVVIDADMFREIGNKLAARQHALSAERARVIERCAMVADNYGREGDRLSKEYACEMADELAARIRALAQQDTGGDDGQE